MLFSLLNIRASVTGAIVHATKKKKISIELFDAMAGNAH